MVAEIQSAVRGPNQFSRLWRNACLATLAADSVGLGLIENAAIACHDSRISFVGPEADLPTGWRADEVIDCQGRLITPGLIDCHTHLVYAGNRASEFERRLNGESYEAIARSGGGIVSTVRATRAATEAQLVAASLPRLDALLLEGVTTVEIKSGYGLNVETEAKQLRAARELANQRAVDVRTTFLGAHALPPEYAGRSDHYIREVCEVMLPALADAGLVDAVDAFCEHIGFSLEQTERVFKAAASRGLRVKLHAEQLSNSHGAALAAHYACLSADHLEHLDEDGVRALAAARATAVLLPGAFYCMRETQLPPLASLRAHGVPIALATDSNPGTAPLTSALLVMNMAATLFRMTIDECLIGLTRAAAGALGLSAEIGTLQVGKYCDLAIWNVERPAELVYNIGARPLHRRVWRGQ
ncbi:MAG TPA: imidazolonepropionase [Polyangiales bacterium]|nr:imidazolonepropionase [Polyangiales bacterium]